MFFITKSTLPQKTTNRQLVNAYLNEVNSSRLNENTQLGLKNIVSKIYNESTIQVIANNFLPELINRIGLVLFRDNYFKNPFSRFVYYDMEFGDAVQEIFVQPAQGINYPKIENGASIDPFKISAPTVKSLYISNRLKRMYPVTIFESEIKQAVTDEYGFQGILERSANSMSQGATLDNYYMFKEILNNTIVVNDTEKGWSLANYPSMYEFNSNGYVNDAKSALNFVKSVKDKISDMLLPSNNYNFSRGTQMLNADDLIIFIRKDVANSIQSYLLASSFNKEDLNFEPAGLDGKIEIITVDDFGGLEGWNEDGSEKLTENYDEEGKFLGYTLNGQPYTGKINYYNNYMKKEPNKNPLYDVACIIADKRLPVITLNLEKTSAVYNAKALYLNQFYHIQSTYGFSGFASYCVFFELNKENTTLTSGLTEVQNDTV